MTCVVDGIRVSKCVGVAAAKADLWSRALAEIRTIQRLPGAVNAVGVKCRAAGSCRGSVENVVLLPGAATEDILGCVIGVCGVQTHAKSRAARIGLLLCD